LSVNLLDTDATLTTTFILLNQADSRNNLHVKSEGIVNYLLHGLGSLVVRSRQVSVHDLVNQELFFFHGLRLGFGLLFNHLLFLLTSFFRLSCFLLAGASNLLFESHLDLDLVGFFEVLRYWDLNDRRVILQVEEQLIEVDVHAQFPWVEITEIFFHFTNASDGGFKYALDKKTFLGVHDLVVALF
jgi:hypothetical protein